MQNISWFQLAAARVQVLQGKVGNDTDGILLPMCSPNSSNTRLWKEVDPICSFTIGQPLITGTLLDMCNKEGDHPATWQPYLQLMTPVMLFHLSLI